MIFQEREVVKMWYFRDRISEKVVVALSVDEANRYYEDSRYIFLRYW